jgi:hypothetical protein
MLHTISRFTSNFVALLTDQATVIDADGRTENIRTAMLKVLLETVANPKMGFSKTWADVTRASDIQTFWYLRSDVLILLSNSQGEQAARDALDGITEMFRGIVPINQMPRAKHIGSTPGSHPYGDKEPNAPVPTNPPGG